MRKICFVVLLVCACLVGLVQAEQSTSEKNLVGAWTGTWTGGSNGAFDMTITKGDDGKLGGSITPKPEGGDSYTVSFKSITVADSKITLKLADPGEEAEITLEASLEGSVLKGTYAVRIKADGNEVDKGTITANKKKE